ncbi:MAG TPA: hypothetical protein VGD40_15235 [Chryseosolibacter sp.]
MKRLLLPLLFVSFSSAFSQHTTEKFLLDWTDGVVIFNTGDTLRCNIRFNQAAAHPILQIRNQDHTLTIPSNDVKQFSFFDSIRNRTRTFTSFPSTEIVNQSCYMERIYGDSHFSILNRKTIETPSELDFVRFAVKPAKIYKRYLFNESTGQLLPLSKENLFQLLETRKSEIASYVRMNGIRFRRISDFIKVFEYHNSL